MAAAASALLPCKLFFQHPIKAGAELFHQILAGKPQHLVTASRGKFDGCQVLEGEEGNGCVTEWNYTLDGNVRMGKTKLENVDMEKKTVTYKMIEGDMLDLYKHLAVTIHVETKEGTDFLAWTLEYELRELDTPHPLSLLKFHVELTNEIEAHLLS